MLTEELFKIGIERFDVFALFDDIFVGDLERVLVNLELFKVLFVFRLGLPEILG